MDLRDLRYFVAVAKTGNLSRAARGARRATRAFPLRRALERELGVILLTRHPKVSRSPPPESPCPGAQELLRDAAHRSIAPPQQRWDTAAGSC